MVATTATSAKRYDVEPTLAALTQLVRDTPSEQRSVAQSAWVVLALLANGSTLRAGTLRTELQEHAGWLARHQRAFGFEVRGAPCSRGEHWLGALAITEACEISSYHIYWNASKDGITSAAATMIGNAARQPTDDEFVVAILLARSAVVAQREPEVIDKIDAARIAARTRMVAGKSRRTDAALHLDELLQRKRHPPELTIALTWPANLTADPLHTLIGALAVPVSPMPEKQRTAQFETLAALVAARETKGEHADTWAPAAGFDRAATTAMHAITLALANGQLPLLCVK